MIPPEYMSVVIEAHRNDLRRLYDPERRGARTHAHRQRLGAQIVRFGQWVENRRIEAISEPPVVPTSQQANT